MFAFFSIGIGLVLTELLHIQAHILQEQRICGCYCFFCEKRNKGPLDGADVNSNIVVKYVHKAIPSPPRRCRRQLVLGSSLLQESPISDLALPSLYLQYHFMRLTFILYKIQF